MLDDTPKKKGAAVGRSAAPENGVISDTTVAPWRGVGWIFADG